MLPFACFDGPGREYWVKNAPLYNVKRPSFIKNYQYISVSDLKIFESLCSPIEESG